jgi:hypothetical protein
VALKYAVCGRGVGRDGEIWCPPVENTVSASRKSLVSTLKSNPVEPSGGEPCTIAEAGVGPTKRPEYPTFDDASMRFFDSPLPQLVPREESLDPMASGCSIYGDLDGPRSK